MRNLIDDVFVSVFDNPALAPLEDQAQIFARGAFEDLGTGWPSPPIPMSSIRCFSQAATSANLPSAAPSMIWRLAGLFRFTLPVARSSRKGLEVDTLRAIAKSMAVGRRRCRCFDRHGRHQGRPQGHLRQTFLNTSGIGSHPRKGSTLAPAVAGLAMRSSSMACLAIMAPRSSMRVATWPSRPRLKVIVPLCTNLSANCSPPFPRPVSFATRPEAGLPQFSTRRPGLRASASKFLRPRPHA